jgi:hypothetical protein
MGTIEPAQDCISHHAASPLAVSTLQHTLLSECLQILQQPHRDGGGGVFGQLLFSPDLHQACRPRSGLAKAAEGIVARAGRALRQ